MSFLFKIEFINLALLLFQVGIVLFILFFLLWILAYLLKKDRLKKVFFVGSIFSLFVFSSSFVVFNDQDWSIPECYDSNGNFIEDNSRCKMN